MKNAHLIEFAIIELVYHFVMIYQNVAKTRYVLLKTTKKFVTVVQDILVNPKLVADY